AAGLGDRETVSCARGTIGSGVGWPRAVRNKERFKASFHFHLSELDLYPTAVRKWLLLTRFSEELVNK
ncbi:MAG TPA: hypothetical protein VK972_05095, partial [Wenzhouxiangella sp.]|nr:hypothetical protein [Wenzhouxiangella sp.]